MIIKVHLLKYCIYVIQSHKHNIWIKILHEILLIYYSQTELSLMDYNLLVDTIYVKSFEVEKSRRFCK